MSTTTESAPSTGKEVILVEGATVRLAGDSGDGMQLAGTQLTSTSALSGNDVATFPDFPAEIRAPKGTLAGVSGYQVHFSSQDIFTPGDKLHALVAMNPAALKTNLADLEVGGLLIVDEDSFDQKSWKLANYDENPLDAKEIEKYRLFRVPMTKLTREATKGQGVTPKEADRCRNFFAMGLVYWLYGRKLEATERYIDAKFSKKPLIAEVNRKALHAGWNYGETTDAFISSYRVEPAKLEPGKYTNIMGNQALAWGLITAAKISNKELFLGSYPITPASDILHELSNFKHFGVRTFQAEDEIAAICSAIGAAYGGAMGITTSSGPGIALKSEAMGLALMLELPLLIIDVQRGGPSTGLPTKTEQADLLQVMFGRNGESPLPIIAARSPGDCFDVALEAWRISTRFMIPVVILTDGYIANGAEPWKLPDPTKFEPIPISHPGPIQEGEKFLPYSRDERLARPWAIPGTPTLMHRVGGLEKQNNTGNVNYEADNHEQMVRLRAEKVANIAKDIPPLTVNGPTEGDLLVLSWGGTYGACKTAVERCQAKGQKVAHAHLRWLSPFPANLGDVLKSYKKVVVAELNLGQLRMLIRAKYLVDAVGLNKVKGKPFAIEEVVQFVDAQLK